MLEDLGFNHTHWMQVQDRADLGPNGAPVQGDP